MFTAALITLGKLWEQPKCPSRDDWIKKKWYLHAMDYYLALKRRKLCNI